MIKVSRTLEIPDHEVEFTAGPSSGPGGQHVNRSHTRVTLCFDLEASDALSAKQKMRIRRELSSRITREGVLQVSCQETRSQHSNKERVKERFAGLLRQALQRRLRRKKTRKPRWAREKRLREKARRSELKKGRSSKIRRDE